MQLQPWIFAPETTEIAPEEYAPVEVIDISGLRLANSNDSESLYTSEKRIRDEIIERTMNAFRTVGCIALKGHGLSSKDFRAQFDLGRILLDDVGESEKHMLHAKVWEGDWAGYKPKGYYKRPDGGADTLEHFDLFPFTAQISHLPDAGKPYVSKIRSFIKHNHYFLLKRVLAILSLGLGLPEEALWKLHHRDPMSSETSNNNTEFDIGEEDHVAWNHCKEHFRYAMYHPLSEEDRIKKKHLSLPGHTDLGSVSFLYSQPIAGLQVLSHEGTWKYVPYYPEHIIVNLGGSMEFLTGGRLKAVPHRVMEPPNDQRHLKRLGVFCFAPLLPEVLLKPLDNLPPRNNETGSEIKDLIAEYFELGGTPLTSNDWYVLRSKLVGSRRTVKCESEPRTTRDVLEDIHFRFNP